MKDDDVREGHAAKGHGAPVATSQFVPDVKEEEILFLRRILDKTNLSGVSCADCCEVNEMVLSEILRLDTLSDNVKTQPGQWEKEVREVLSRCLTCGTLFFTGLNHKCTPEVKALLGKKEAVADFVEAQGQNELRDTDYDYPTVAERKTRFAHLLRNKFSIPPQVASHISCDFHAILLDALQDARADARAASDVKEYETPRQLPKSSVSANAQGPMEEREKTLVNHIWRMIADYENPKPETAAYVPRENLGSTLRTLLMGAGYEWENAPSLIKEQPAKQDLEERADKLMERSVFAMSIMEDDEELWREAYEKSDKCPMLTAAFELRQRVEDLEKEAVTRNMAVLQIALNALEHCRQRPHEHNPLPDWQGPTHCEVIDRAIADVKGLLSEADGQPEGASGILSKDAARLDWLEHRDRACLEVRYQPRIGIMLENEVRIHKNGTGVIAVGRNFREAIDAAMAPSPLLDSGEQKE